MSRDEEPAIPGEAHPEGVLHARIGPVEVWDVCGEPDDEVPDDAEHWYSWRDVGGGRHRVFRRLAENKAPTRLAATGGETTVESEVQHETTEEEGA